MHDDLRMGRLTSYLSRDRGNCGREYESDERKAHDDKSLSECKRARLLLRLIHHKKPRFYSYPLNESSGYTNRLNKGQEHFPTTPKKFQKGLVDGCHNGTKKPNYIHVHMYR
jgi:hypothetical protein